MPGVIWKIAALALLVTTVTIPILSRLALRFGFVDQPNARKIHQTPIPLVGGIAVYLGVVVALYVFAWFDYRVKGIVVASALVLLLGLLDDRFDLPSRYRLLLQMGVALGLSLAGVRLTLFGIPALDHAITVLWIVAAVNAFNCMDCADGTAGATCAVIFGSLALLAAFYGRTFVASTAVAGLGAVLGFLWFNRPPARVFLGDTGSTFLGLMIAALALLAVPSTGSGVKIPWGVLMLTIPMCDFVLVHVRRYRAGVRSVRELLASTGKDHLPHRLRARGLGQNGVVAMVTVLTLLMAGSAIAFDRYVNQFQQLAMGREASSSLLLWGVMALVVTAALLWHLDEDAWVQIRSEDRVAIFRPPAETTAGVVTLSQEETLA